MKKLKKMFLIGNGLGSYGRKAFAESMQAFYESKNQEQKQDTEKEKEIKK